MIDEVKLTVQNSRTQSAAGVGLEQGAQQATLSTHWNCLEGFVKMNMFLNQL